MLKAISESTLKSLGEMLKEQRIKLGYSTRELSEKLESISHTEINMLENGKRKKPDPIILRAIAKELKLDYLELFKLLGYISAKAIKSLETTKVPLSQKIKVYGSVSAGIGEVGEVIYGEFIKTIYLPYSNKECIGVIVNGDSMEPKIPDKSIVIVDTSVKELKNKNVGVFIINEESYVKRVMKTEKSEFLTSDNPNYPPIFFNDYDNITVVGKVVTLIIENIWLKC